MVGTFIGVRVDDSLLEKIDGIGLPRAEVLRLALHKFLELPWEVPSSEAELDARIDSHILQFYQDKAVALKSVSQSNKTDRDLLVLRAIRDHLEGMDPDLNPPTVPEIVEETGISEIEVGLVLKRHGIRKTRRVINGRRARYILPDQLSTIISALEGD